MTTEYDQLLYADYLRIRKIAESIEDATQRTTAVLSVLTGKTEDELLDLPLNEYRKLADKASFLTGSARNVAVRKEYQLGEMLLTPCMKMEDMTAGQYIDFQEYLKADNKDIELLSCLLVPKGRKYLVGYDAADVIEAIRRHLTAPDGIALTSFFVLSLLASTASSLMSSARATKDRKQRRQMMKAAKTYKKTLLRSLLANGDGWLSRMQSLKLAASLGGQSYE